MCTKYSELTSMPALELLRQIKRAAALEAKNTKSPFDAAALDTEFLRRANGEPVDEKLLQEEGK